MLTLDSYGKHNWCCQPMDLVTRAIYKRWCEYTQRCGAHGLSWPEWRDAYEQGIIR